MATLTAMKLPTVDGARQVMEKLQDLQQQQLIVIHDAAIVQWPADKAKPRGTDMDLIATNLSKEDEDRLRRAFEEEHARADPRTKRARRP